MVTRKLLGLLFALAFVMPSAVWGQFESAAVLGTVRDSAQAIIIGASVRLENVATGVVSQAVTDENGDYQFLNVRAGRYVVKVEKAGFAKTSASEFTVTVGARQRVDMTLQVASTSETVTVTDAAAALETDTSARGHVAMSSQIVNLPLNGRSYADIALLRRASVVPL